MSPYREPIEEEKFSLSMEQKLKKTGIAILCFWMICFGLWVPWKVWKHYHMPCQSYLETNSQVTQNMCDRSDQKIKLLTNGWYACNCADNPVE